MIAELEEQIERLEKDANKTPVDGGNEELEDEVRDQSH